MWWYVMSIQDAKCAWNLGLQEAASLAAKAVLSTFIQPILSCPCSPKLADLYIHPVDEFLFIFCKWITMNHYSKPIGTCRRSSLQSWVLCLDASPQDPFHVLTEQAGNLTLQAIFVCIWWIALTVMCSSCCEAAIHRFAADVHINKGNFKEARDRQQSSLRDPREADADEIVGRNNVQDKEHVIRLKQIYFISLICHVCIYNMRMIVCMYDIWEWSGLTVFQKIIDTDITFWVARLVEDVWPVCKSFSGISVCT